MSKSRSPAARRDEHKIGDICDAFDVPSVSVSKFGSGVSICIPGVRCLRIVNARFWSKYLPSSVRTIVDSGLQSMTVQIFANTLLESVDLAWEVAKQAARERVLAMKDERKQLAADIEAMLSIEGTVRR